MTEQNKYSVTIIDSGGNNMKKLRVIVDFQETEQAALNALCQADYRLPDDQIRWLVINAAKHRGIISDKQLSTNAESDTTGQGKRVALSA